MATESAEQQAVCTLRDSIITGRIQAGAQLNQSALARELGISRIPVRHALQVLVAEGLVRDGRSGPVVAPLAVGDLEEIYEIREAVEPLATRFAISHVGRAHVMQMEGLLEAMRQADDLAQWLAANRGFHRVVYKQSNRPRMIELIDNLSIQTDRYLWLYLTVDDIRTQFDEQHELILDAARRGDADGIEELTKLHLVTAHRALLRQLLPLEDGFQQAGAIGEVTSWLRGSTLAPAWPVAREGPKSHGKEEGR